MQISLFSAEDPDLSKRARQVITRHFSLYTKNPLAPLLNSECTDEHFLRVRSKALAEIQNNTISDLKLNRAYHSIGVDIVEDNLKTLELLGVGVYTKEYIVHLDFSAHLDYFLYLLTGCNPQNIRDICEFSQLSSDLLKKENLSEFNLANFVGIDPHLDNYLIQLLGEISLNLGNSPLTMRDITGDLAYQLYVRLMKKVADVRDFVAIQLVRKFDGDFVYRSKGYSDAICTASSPIMEKIELVLGESDVTCEIIPRNYKRLAYAFSQVEVP